MKQFMQRLKVLVLVLALGVLINGAGPEEDPVLSPGVYCSTPPPGQDPVEWCSYIRSMQNLNFISFEVEATGYFSFQYPATYAALGQSIYACVREQDLTNPYSGQPVQQQADPTPGNLRWTYDAQTRNLTIEMAFSLGGQTRLMPRTFAGTVLDIYSAQELQHPQRKYPPDASESVKHTWMCGWVYQVDYIDSEYPALMQTPNYDVPPSYDETVRRFPVLKKMWNPFQNRFAQHVPMETGWETPHPGDLSYLQITGGDFEFYFWGEPDENGDVSTIY